MNTIRMGVPEMEELWNHLTASVSAGTASKDEIRLYKRLGKAMVLPSRQGRFCLTLVPPPKGYVVNFEHNPNRSRAKGIPKPSPRWGRWHGEAVTDEVL